MGSGVMAKLIRVQFVDGPLAGKTLGVSSAAKTLSHSAPDGRYTYDLATGKVSRHVPSPSPQAAAQDPQNDFPAKEHIDWAKSAMLVLGFDPRGLTVAEVENKIAQTGSILSNVVDISECLLMLMRVVGGYEELDQAKIDRLVAVKTRLDAYKG